MAPRVAFLATAVAAALLSGTPAKAAAPTRSPLYLSDTVLTSGYCPFAIAVDFTMQHESMITYADGSWLIVGAFDATFINLENHRMVTLSVSGATRYAYDPVRDLADATFDGSSLVFGIGFIYLVTGHGEFVSAPTGTTISFDQQGGTSTDVCAAVAS